MVNINFNTSLNDSMWVSIFSGNMFKFLN